MKAQNLCQIKDWLLPKLMNRQVTVGVVEDKLVMVAEDNAKYGNS